MISNNNYRKCGIAINLLDIMNGKHPNGIVMFDTSMRDVGNLIYDYCNVEIGTLPGDTPDSRTQIHIKRIKSHKKSAQETKQYLELIVKKLGKDYWEAVEFYKNALGDDI